MPDSPIRWLMISWCPCHAIAVLDMTDSSASEIGDKLSYFRRDQWIKRVVLSQERT
jgi:hypothetical protein